MRLAILAGIIMLQFCLSGCAGNWRVRVIKYEVTDTTTTYDIRIVGYTSASQPIVVQPLRPQRVMMESY